MPCYEGVAPFTDQKYVSEEFSLGVNKATCTFKHSKNLLSGYVKRKLRTLWAMSRIYERYPFKGLVLIAWFWYSQVLMAAWPVTNSGFMCGESIFLYCV